MKFGVREICDVVLKAKSTQTIGNKKFYANEPVVYFDTLKTSSMEGAATTVYAQGGRGNSRLVAWEGERTVTFTMEDALISPEGFMILSGAGLVSATESTPIYQHVTETIDVREVKIFGENPADEAFEIQIPVSNPAYLPDEKDHYAYVMLMKNGNMICEPLIPLQGGNKNGVNTLFIDNHAAHGTLAHNYAISGKMPEFDAVLVDYYTEKKSGAQQIEIAADKFGGNYYLEASTLFRDQNGVDMPAEFIIPNCKVQSNFTFTMASSGDPSTFTFTMDAFPDYTRFDRKKKVLAAIQIIGEAGDGDAEIRNATVLA